MANRRPLVSDGRGGSAEITTTDRVDPAVLPVTLSIVEATADTTNATTTAADIAGLGIPVAAGAVVQFRYTLIVDAAAATTGIQIALNGPASPTALTARIVAPTSATTDQTQYVNAYETYNVALSSAGTLRAVAVIEGVLRNGATAGTLIPRIKSEVGLSQVASRIGSYGTYH